MSEWQQKQAKFDQLPIDVEAINAAIMHLNQTIANVNNAVVSLEADMNVLVMLVSRIEQCLQQQTQALDEVRDVMVESFGKK
jgi:predicted  nucleic acid-binding Zn-ribbon protein